MAFKIDRRARLSPKSGYAFGFNGPASVLRQTNGILFPYTPTINISHTVEYAPYEVVHNNYQQNSYTKTKNPSISVAGTFTATTQNEARYTVGVIHFLRVVSKMAFGGSGRPGRSGAGNSGEIPGTPPPVLNFNAYGVYNFHNVPVVVSDFSYQFDNEQDYVEIQVESETVQIPATTQITITLMPHYHPGLQNQFTIGDFSRGTLYRRGFI